MGTILQNGKERRYFRAEIGSWVVAYEQSQFIQKQDSRTELLKNSLAEGRI